MMKRGWLDSPLFFVSKIFEADIDGDGLLSVDAWSIGGQCCVWTHGNLRVPMGSPPNNTTKGNKAVLEGYES